MKLQVGSIRLYQSYSWLVWVVEVARLVMPRRGRILWVM